MNKELYERLSNTDLVDRDVLFDIDGNHKVVKEIRTSKDSVLTMVTLAILNEQTHLLTLIDHRDFLREKDAIVAYQLVTEKGFSE